MNKNQLITYLDQNETATPLISADIIAQEVHVKHKSINQSVRGLNESEVGQVLFQKAGKRKVYYLNQYQAMKLLNGLRTNSLTKKAREQLQRVVFEQFSQAIHEQQRRKLVHEMGKPLTHDLNDAIKNNPYFNDNSYLIYNNLIYKIALNEWPKDLKKNRNIPKSKNITEYLSYKESQKVQEIKGQVIAFLNAKLKYQDIKNILLNANKITSISSKVA
jgi:hypothetical protein